MNHLAYNSAKPLSSSWKEHQCSCYYIVRTVSVQWSVYIYTVHQRKCSVSLSQCNHDLCQEHISEHSDITNTSLPKHWTHTFMEECYLQCFQFLVTNWKVLLQYLYFSVLNLSSDLNHDIFWWIEVESNFFVVKSS